MVILTVKSRELILCLKGCNKCNQMFLENTCFLLTGVWAHFLEQTLDCLKLHLNMVYSTGNCSSFIAEILHVGIWKKALDVPKTTKKSILVNIIAVNELTVKIYKSHYFEFDWDIPHVGNSSHKVLICPFS